MKGMKLPMLPSEGFVRLSVVLQVLGIGKTTFYMGIKEGKYPHPVKIGPRTSAWRVEDIREVIAKLSKGVLNAREKSKKQAKEKNIEITGGLEIKMKWIARDCPASGKKHIDDRA